MTKKIKKTEDTQINLLDSSVLENSTLRPRNRKIPYEIRNPKNTDATYSAFGWHFQIFVAVCLSIINIKRLDNVIVEGSTEDIELYFSDSEPAYIQVKSMQGNPADTSDTTKATAALNTLINTTNVVKDKYSQLMYVANFRNIFTMPIDDLNSFWKPDIAYPYISNYNNLSADARTFLDDRITAAKSSLEKKGYTSSSENLNLNKLSVATFFFNSNSDSNHQYEMLENIISDFFDSVNFRHRRSSIQKVLNMLTREYLHLAGIKSSDTSKNITKKDITWKIIYSLMDSILPDDFNKNIPLSIKNDIEAYEDDFFIEQSSKIEIINQVLSSYQIYLKQNDLSQNDWKSFLSSEWGSFIDIFPDDSDPILQEYSVKSIIFTVLTNETTIHKIKRGTNLK